MQRALSAEIGVDYDPRWRSPVCRITPGLWRNHTGCSWTLCTCGCHKPVPQPQPALFETGEVT